jgi:segregation and condensation protein B
MAKRPSQTSGTSVLSLGIEPLLPDGEDQGLSLEELGEAYAALLQQQRADPYPEEDEPSAAAESPPSVDDVAWRVLAGSDGESGEITPRTIVEAILFVGHPCGDAPTSEAIAGLMRGVTPAEIDDLVIELNEAYAAEGRPYTIRSVAAGYQLALREEFDSLRERFYGKIREARLSQAAIDVLAIVVYHQPITLEEIDRLRGKASSPILSQLVRRELIAIQRSVDKKQRPIYRTTDRFLDLYNLESLDDLPQVERSL